MSLYDHIDRLLFAYIEDQDIKKLNNLLEYNCNINIKNKNKETLLIKACEYPSIDIVKLLVEAGADLDEQSSRGYTALMTACSNHNFETCKFLIDSGANVKIKDIYGNSTFYIACIHCPQSVIEKIIKTESVDLDDLNSCSTLFSNLYKPGLFIYLKNIKLQTQLKNR